jgi:hypothetical protein
MNIKNTIPWKVTRWLYHKSGIRHIVQMYFTKYDRLEFEHLKHFGRDFPEKTFYVIRILNSAGLLSDFHHVLNHICYAISKGYIPIVNWESYWNMHTEKTPVEVGGSITSNSWEYFFEQPCGYSLKDIKKAKNVILGDSVKRYFDSIDSIYSKPFPFNDRNAISKYNEFTSKYCRINLNTRKHIKVNKELLFGDKNNILGISYRTTGYKGQKDHSIGATIKKMIEKMSEIFYKEKFDHIFISTEEQEIVDEIYKVFPEEKIINPTRKRYKTIDQKKYLEEALLFYRKKESIFEYELNYLTEIHLLSQCDGIIASNLNNGLVFALGLNNNKYRYSFIFELGVQSFGR